MNFATLLAQLVDHLRQLPSQTPPHLQHLSIRVQRAKTQAELGQGVEGLERLVRLRSRLEELEEGLNELELDHDQHEHEATRWHDLRHEAKMARLALEEQLDKASSTIKKAIPNSSSLSHQSATHSRSSSTSSLPRRTPSPSPLPLGSESLSQPLVPPRVPSLVEQRAKSLSEAYSLFLLSTSPSSILPSGQSLSSIAAAAAASSPRPSTLTNHFYLRYPTLEAQQTYFDDLVEKLSKKGREGGKEAWNQVGTELAKSCLGLIPTRGRSSNTLKREMKDLLLTKHQHQQEEEKEEEEQDEDKFATIQTLLQVLRKLCAPARDEQVKKVLERARHPHQEEEEEEDEGCSKAKRLVRVVRETLELARDMEQDLERFRSQFKVKFKDERQALGAVREEAGERERRIVRELIVREEGNERITERSVDREIRERTARWVRKTRREEGTDDPEQASDRVAEEEIVKALIDALFENEPVSIPPVPGSPSHLPLPGSASSNSVPPILYSTCPRLFELQNQFQALTILACISTILSTRPSSRRLPLQTKDDLSHEPLLSRLWSILKSEIPSFANNTNNDNDDTSSASLPRAFESSTPTRLVHLSDEILAHLNKKFPSSNATRTEEEEKEAEEEEEQERAKSSIKDSVDRILRFRDPVFKLLHSRLKDGIESVLVTALLERRQEGRSNGSQQRGGQGGGGGGTFVPSSLKTGKSLTTDPERSRAVQAVTLSTFGGGEEEKYKEIRLGRMLSDKAIASIKGFENVRVEIEETLKDKLVPLFDWVHDVWGEVLSG